MEDSEPVQLTDLATDDKQRCEIIYVSPADAVAEFLSEAELGIAGRPLPALRRADVSLNRQPGVEVIDGEPVMDAFLLESELVPRRAHWRGRMIRTARIASAATRILQASVLVTALAGGLWLYGIHRDSAAPIDVDAISAQPVATNAISRPEASDVQVPLSTGTPDVPLHAGTPAESAVASSFTFPSSAEAESIRPPAAAAPMSNGLDAVIVRGPSNPKRDESQPPVTAGETTEVAGVLQSRSAATSPATSPLPATPSLLDRGIASTPALLNRGSDEPRVADPAPPAVNIPSTPRPSGDAPLRELLASYQTAYERLNADLAKQVWPDVDERALARAFSALESQTVTFDDCQLRIEDVRATASCRGSATFVTRVGRRSSRSEQREWTFLFGKADDRWVIDAVRIR